MILVGEFAGITNALPPKKQKQKKTKKKTICHIWQKIRQVGNTDMDTSFTPATDT